MKNVNLINYKKILNNKGNLYKLLDKNYYPNHIKGEIYISQIKYDEVKAWRMHKSYDAIFIVIAGIIELKCMDNKNKLIFQENLSLDSCNLVKVNCGTWYGFKGISENTASILAILDGCHDENEIKRLSTNDYQF